MVTFFVLEAKEHATRESSKLSQPESLSRAKALAKLKSQIVDPFHRNEGRCQVFLHMVFSKSRTYRLIPYLLGFFQETNPLFPQNAFQ